MATNKMPTTFVCKGYELSKYKNAFAKIYQKIFTGPGYRTQQRILDMRQVI